MDTNTESSLGNENTKSRRENKMQWKKPVLKFSCFIVDVVTTFVSSLFLQFHFILEHSKWSEYDEQQMHWQWHKGNCKNTLIFFYEESVECACKILLCVCVCILNQRNKMKFFIIRLFFSFYFARSKVFLFLKSNTLGVLRVYMCYFLCKFYFDVSHSH